MINFDVRQLEYFVYAARLGSYSKAAQVLFVTPQAISRSIQLLEAHLGATLFERKAGGVALTEFGCLVFDDALAALGSLQQLQKTIDAYQNTESIHIRVGIHSLCFEENGGSLQRTNLLEFKKHISRAEFTFLETPGSDIVEGLLDDTLDFGITVPPYDLPDSLQQLLLKKFPLAAVVSRAYPDHFATSDECVTPKELTRGELVLFSQEHAYNDFLINQAALEGYELPTSSILVSPHGDMGFIENSRRYIVRPLQHAKRTIHDERLRILPIHNSRDEEIRVPLSLIMKKSRVLNAPDNAFIEYARKQYR